MNFYEHTIIARQDTSPGQLKQIQDKYTDLVIKHDGKVVKTETWGLLNLAYLIKKNKIVKSIRGKKGGYILIKKASELKISDILIAVDERIKTIGCKKQSKQGCNGRSSKCITHDFWEELEDHIHNFFKKKKIRRFNQSNKI